MIETGSLAEVQKWDLEDLEAYLAVLEMRNDMKAAAQAFAMRDTEKGKRGRR